MRPLYKNPPVKKEELSETAQKFWESAQRAGAIEYTEEKVLFSLTEKEVKKCRYEIINQSERMAECTVHRQDFSHGVRLHPPHLWDIQKGIVYFRNTPQSEWEKWNPNVKENLSRLEE